MGKLKPILSLQVRTELVFPYYLSLFACMHATFGDLLRRFTVCRILQRGHIFEISQINLPTPKCAPPHRRTTTLTHSLAVVRQLKFTFRNVCRLNDRTVSRKPAHRAPDLTAIELSQRYNNHAHLLFVFVVIFYVLSEFFFSAVCEFRFFFSLLLWLSLLFCLIGDGIFSADAVVNNYLSPLLMDFKMCNLFLLLLFSVIITFFTLSPVLPCQLLMSPHAAEITRHASFMLPLWCSTSQLHSTQSVRHSACQLNGECNVTNVGMFTRICRKYEIIDSYAA